jgi:uncharacterized membrane protein (UPF0127 family)
MVRIILYDGSNSFDVAMKKVLALVIVLVVMIGGFVVWSDTAQAPTQEVLSGSTEVSLGNSSVIADVVDTEDSRRKGLSGHEPLEESEGMLFVFQSDAEHSFWMKDMLFSIDMIWLDANKTVIHIEENATPESYPRSFGPSAPSRYVLEVPAGWAKRHAVVVGSVASF